jgi:PBP1b-binding outer membrane lipoprotein LpoB
MAANKGIAGDLYMGFIKNAEQLAQKAMNEINRDLALQYTNIIKFLSYYPEFASLMRGCSSAEAGTEEYIKQQASTFANSRVPRPPKPPTTVPDEMVSEILVSYFDIAPSDIERVKREHLLSMGAENMVGDLLERYLASVMEPRGWIWCSGSLVKAVDFIKLPVAAEPWRLLQVKNRDNSENSSSSAIRKGTSIEKWHRTFSRKTGSNWDAFPDPLLRQELSEEAFKSFVKIYLYTLRNA